MKRLIGCMMACCALIPAAAQTADLFNPYKDTKLRLPSVPLVVSDPYFSIWSPYDRLNCLLRAINGHHE